MRDGTPITVVHKGRCWRGNAYGTRAEDRYWYAFTFLANAPAEGSIALDDEDVRWTRGWLFAWWPPHRKRMRALVTADALAGLPAKRQPGVPMQTGLPAAQTAQSALDAANQMIADANKRITDSYRSMMRDANKMIADANKAVRNASGTTKHSVTIRITKRR